MTDRLRQFTSAMRRLDGDGVRVRLQLFAEGPCLRAHDDYGREFVQWLTEPDADPAGALGRWHEALTPPGRALRSDASPARRRR